MKMRLFAVSVAVALFALAGCGQSAKEVEQIRLDRQNAANADNLARREAIDELRLAKERAKVAGARFASDAKLIRAYQCNTRLAAEKLGQVPGYKRFADEMRKPFNDGCVREARVILRNLQLAAAQAVKARAAEKMRLAAAAKKGANKK